MTVVLESEDFCTLGAVLERCCSALPRAVVGTYLCAGTSFDLFHSHSSIHKHSYLVFLLYRILSSVYHASLTCLFFCNNPSLLVI